MIFVTYITIEREIERDRDRDREIERDVPFSVSM